MPFASRSEGTGIGLFVIRDVLEQLGGSVEVQTREATDPEGRGTTFTVTIPAIQVHAPAALDRDREPAELMRILIVDDLPDVRSALSEVTGRLGHSCIAVGSAAEARPLLASEDFDVVLIDLEIPDTDGLALAAEIRQGGGRNTAAYFSDRGRPFQADRGRQNDVAEVALGRRAGTGLNVAESSTISLKRAAVGRVSGVVFSPT